ncbi:MAG: apolipoprotein N-acyltransferase [Microcoleus sp. PH2017_33_LGB_O_A]|uniref:apolipoprotein N-acyltransferase n=1 Tax=Microcoleus sp. PH2017_33_LGB_O_A TaxID=2798843 RepID=UPI001DCC5E14|nr:apolipoprotein N-acyltransferase [Microcoleus sp. PH2017_33_LGB_O_A]MCC3641475.1 apolipoprotein N-acyltransferase [Microcoleus sp. PH2017_33_LGB_O_A]
MAIFKRLKFEKLAIEKSQILGGAIAFFSGILMALTTAPFNAWLLAWVVLAPLWVLVVSYERPIITEKKPKVLPSFLFILPSSFFLLPALWGIGYHGLAISWIMGIHPMTWLGVPWWPSLAIALFCWIFITFWGSALVTLWAWLFAIVTSHISGTGILPVISQKISGTGILPVISQKISGTGILISQKISGTGILPAIRVLIGTALWCALESIWSTGSLWWTSLSYTQSPHNLAILHLGQLSGPSAVTAAVVAVNGLIAEAFIAGRRKKEEGLSASLKVKRGKKEEGKGEKEEGRGKNWIAYIVPAGLFLVLHIVGWSFYNRPLIQEAGTALQIGIIQGNIPNEIKFDSGGWRRALEGYTAGYKELADRGVDAVLLPETALPFIWTNEYQRSTLSFYQAILQRGVLAWVGGFGQEGDSMTNSLLAIDKTGEIVSRYDKLKLVPLGEYIPFYEILGGIINRLSPLDTHLVPGNSKQWFNTPFGHAIVGICYDSAFAEVFRYQAANGGEFILTASNNAHYKPPMLAQHHALDVMRAIETDRWAAIATNTGYSAFVNPRGETIWKSGINTYEVRDATIYRRQTRTLYVRWGDWLTPLLLVLAGLMWLIARN